MKYSGVYKIVNQLNGNIYIGSSAGVECRLRQHRSELIRGIHHNIHLQRAWNKYGSENFIFDILEKVDNDADLLVVEQLWIDACKSSDTKVYNIAPRAGFCLGVKRSEETCTQQSARKREWFLSEDGIKHRQFLSKFAKSRSEHIKLMFERSQTEECRRKQSVSAKEKCRTPEWEKQQERMTAAKRTPSGRLHNAQAQKKTPVIEILEAAASGMEHVKIGELYGRSRSTVENTIHFRCLGGMEITPHMRQLAEQADEWSRKRITANAIAASKASHDPKVESERSTTRKSKPHEIK